MKSLVLAEKPSVARDIARVLEMRQVIERGDGRPGIYRNLGTGPSCRRWRIRRTTIRQLQRVEDGGPADAAGCRLSWRSSDRRAKQYQRRQGHSFTGRTWKDIIIATDAGREGELVARLILKKAGMQKAHPATVDFLCHGQGHPGGICPFKGRKGVR